MKHMARPPPIPTKKSGSATHHRILTLIFGSGPHPRGQPPPMQLQAPKNDTRKDQKHPI